MLETMTGGPAMGTSRSPLPSQPLLEAMVAVFLSTAYHKMGILHYLGTDGADEPLMNCINKL